MLSCIVMTCRFILCLLHTNHDTSAFSPHLFPAQKSFFREKVSKYHYLEEIAF